MLGQCWLGHVTRKTVSEMTYNVSSGTLNSPILLAVIRQISGNEFVFQQDSAHETIELLRRETLDFVSPEQWPPNSPDLNPVDYKLWAIMQQRVYQTKIRNVDELRHCLLNIWNSIEQVIDASIDEWRVRLKACVRSGGGHFEHMLYIYLHRYTNKQITFLVNI